MGIPTFVSSEPEDADSNVVLNIRPSLVFSEALLASTVNPALVQLRNVDLDEIVDTQITYTAGDSDFIIVPGSLLIPNATYIVTVVGTDTAGALGALKSTTSNELASTQLITFTTGTDLSTEGLEKTPEDAGREGDLSLPSDVVVLSRDFVITSTNPQNHAWYVPRDLSRIEVNFSDGVDGTTVTENTFIVDIVPFFSEDYHFAVDVNQPSTSDYTTIPQFEFEGDEDFTGGVLDFDPPGGSISAAGDQILWQPSGEFPYNSCIEITIDSSIASTGAVELPGDRFFRFYSVPWPDWVNVRKVRHEMFPVDLTDYTDDILGLTIWSKSMEVLPQIREAVQDWFQPDRILKQLIACQSVAEIYYMLTAEKGILQGQEKILGDLEIVYRHPTSRSADTKPFKLTQTEKKIEDLMDVVTRLWEGTPRQTVKGWLGIHERPDYRRRLWADWEAARFNTSQVVDTVPAGNTAREREPGLPGSSNLWR
jgi:hypothetical protein